MRAAQDAEIAAAKAEKVTGRPLTCGEMALPSPTISEWVSVLALLGENCQRKMHKVCVHILPRVSL